MRASSSITVELQALEALSLGQLQALWRRHFRCPPPRHASVRFLTLAVAYAMQERTHKGLAPAMRRDLAAIAHGQAPSPPTVHAPVKPGTRFLREWHGRTHEVIATDRGFVWNGRTFKSLSAVATAITGAKWNGRRFFGVRSPST